MPKKHKIVDCDRVLALAVLRNLDSASALAKELSCSRSSAWGLLGGASNRQCRVSQNRLLSLTQVLGCEPDAVLAELDWTLEVRLGRKKMHVSAVLDHQASKWSWQAPNLSLTLHESKNAGPHLAVLEFALPEGSTIQAVLAGGFRQRPATLTLAGYTVGSDSKVSRKSVAVSGTAATRS